MKRKRWKISRIKKGTEQLELLTSASWSIYCFNHLGKLVASNKAGFHLNKVKKQARLTIVLEVRIVVTFGMIVIWRGHMKGFG